MCVFHPKKQKQIKLEPSMTPHWIKSLDQDAGKDKEVVRFPHN